MRSGWLVGALAAAAVLFLVFLGLKNGHGRRDQALDSLGVHGDSIAQAAGLGADSTAIVADSIEADRQAVAFERDLAAQGAALADARGDSILKAGPRKTGSRPSSASNSASRSRARPTEDEAPPPCLLDDEECSDSLADAQKAAGTAIEVDTAEAIRDSTATTDSIEVATPSDSIAWLAAIVANDSVRIEERDRVIAGLANDTLALAKQIGYWRDRSVVLLRQVDSLHATNTKAVAVGKGRGKLDLGLFSIPRPRCGAGPGGTVGLASNSHGTSFGGAIGATAACVIPFSGDD